MMDKEQISARAFRNSEQAGSSAALSSLAEPTLVPNCGQFKGIIGNSPALRRVLDVVEKVANSDTTILITGESGTGKELIARAIHDRSRRADQNLVPMNCGAIPEELLESELFGHVRGAFTGAVKNREGRFSFADSGTIFLDEIGDMRPNLQIKLLRVLQERSFEPVGSSKTVKVDVRVIAATNQDLEQAIQEKRFRADLFYRLNVIPINLPSLRERREDVPVLMQHFLERARSEGRSRVEGISNDALELLCEYGWPGNVREVENLVERLVVMCGEGVIRVEDLPTSFRPEAPFTRVAPRVPSTGISLSEEVNRFEIGLILQALEHTHWNKQQAAQLLRMNRTTLTNKIKRKGLTGDSAKALESTADPSDASFAGATHWHTACADGSQGLIGGPSMTDVNNKVRSLNGEGAETRESARTRLHEFLEELGQALGGDRDALSLIDANQRFAEMRERVRELFERRADELALSASALDSSDTIQFLETLADAIEIKDPSMYGHASRVAYYAGLLAERTGMEPREIEEVRLAAFLHDIGKLGVPIDLLLRPGALDSTERALVKQHAEIGSRLLKPLALPASVSLTACHHHEWWNGSGYPDGLSNEQIPLTARIIGIVDAFDAMTSDRPYSAALSREAAIEELHRFSGVQFDPILEKEFILVLESDASGSDPEIVADIVADVGQSTKATRQNSAAAHGSMPAFLPKLIAHEGIEHRTNKPRFGSTSE